MNIACVIPYSESKFRYKNIKDSIQFTYFNILSCYLKSKGLNVQVFDFLFDESANMAIEKQRYESYLPNVVIVNTAFCLEDFHFYDQHIRTGAENVIIGCGVGVLDYSMALNRLPYVDYVVPVQDEPVIYKLIQFISGVGELPNGVAYRKYNTIYFENIKDYDIDEVYDCQDIMTYISKEDPKMAYIVASKGCWYGQCSFCTVAGAASFYKKNGWFCRNIDNVVKEILNLFQKGTVRFHFMDTEFIGPGKIGLKRVERFAKSIIDSQVKIQFIIDARVDNIDEYLFSMLKKAGLQRAFLGIESGCQKTVDRFNKKQTIQQIDKAIKILNDLNIDYKVGSMFAAPDTNLDEIKESLNYFMKKRLYKVMGIVGVGSVFHQLHLHAGTADYTFYEQHLNKKDQLESEIPVKYFNADVEFFFNYLERIHDQVKKRYYTISCERQADATQDKREIYIKWQNALRILSFNILNNIIVILQTENKGEIELLCEKCIQDSLSNFDKYWAKRRYAAIL